jgi:parvulin-like peptidyl-prolyl isomerase
MSRSFVREPLVHFLILGAALFLLDAWLRPPADAAAGGEIVVSEARIRNLAQTFRRTWQRPPTPPELKGLIRDFVREEILYREALALGLDRDDTIIRRRLRQKMEFVSEEAAALAKPTDKELADYLAAHADQFRLQARATFTQVYLDPRRRAKTLEADAKRLLDALNAAGSPAAPAKVSDSLLLLEPRYENAPESEVARLFGEDFATVLFKQPVARWVGPIASGYGVHLVRLESMTPGGVAALDDVRPLLEREWANAKRKELSEAFYERLRAKYKVTVKMPEGARSDGAQAGGAPGARKP